MRLADIKAMKSESENSAENSISEQMKDMDSSSDPGKALRLAESFVKKFYLDDLHTFKVNNVPINILDISADSNIRLFKISGLVFNKNENVLDRLNNVYSSMHSLNLSILFMIVSRGSDIELYIGTKASSEFFSENSEKAFEKSFGGNFPGSKLSPIDSDDCEALLKDICPENGQNAVTSLTSLPSLKDDDSTNEQYIQGIEKFVDTMQSEKYTVLIISDPVSGGQIEQIKQGYEELYTELAPLSECSLTVGKNDGINISQSDMEGVTDTIGRSVSKTQSFTKGTSITKSQSTTNTFGFGVGTMGSLGNSSSFSENYKKNIFSTLGRNLVGGKITSAAMNGVSQVLGATLGINFSKAKQTGTSEGESQQKQTGIQEGENTAHGEMQQHGVQEGFSIGSTTSSMVKYENKSIKVFLECIDEHLKRLKECENYGMWSSAAYFISPSKETSIISASAYKGIINGEGTSLEAVGMNTWFKDDETKKVNEYLRHFTHPRLYDPDFYIDFDAPTDMSPSTMLSTKEIAIQCSVPYKSIPGVFVREMSEFGRNVFDINESEQRIRIGSIYHMGKVYHEQSVSFDIESLREHTFITGSTGSGKSSIVYELVSKLNNENNETYSLNKQIPTLIIEPAKGEYKQVFGNRFNVFGTNPSVSELLRINPFKFEKNIHILEHIDRLIDIFNVCWPMYAAMPAVLKEAVEDAYVNCGWDLFSSVNISGYEIYPCFSDLLSSLRKVIKNSDYSQEVKDNYTGSLITRVKSLTNGLNGQIFTANEIESNILFEENTIVDLSRVGSSETKAMIMGILIMRLQERRMSQGGINRDLRHITVVEEAHHLLKRTSTEQSSEGSNLLGKSVEMIANAIAEMRTYGEGFIIADQAPGLLDMSVIRNTNTKIIMHLPDLSDRELVGKAAGLTDDQIAELAKIPSRVAAIYQNKWVEPVLCKIDDYYTNLKEYEYNPKKANTKSVHSIERGKIAQLLVSKLSGNEPTSDTEELKKWLIETNIEFSRKIKILELLDTNKTVSRKDVETALSDLVDPEKSVFKKAKNSKNVEEWNATLLGYMNIDTNVLSTECINTILECIIHHSCLECKADEENYLKWMNYMGRRAI